MGKIKDFISVLQTFQPVQLGYSAPRLGIKVFWAVLTVLVSTVIIYQWSILIKQYLRYPTITEVTMASKEGPFPAVTICNLNPIKQSKAKTVPQLSEMLAACDMEQDPSSKPKVCPSKTANVGPTLRKKRNNEVEHRRKKRAADTPVDCTVGTKERYTVMQFFTALHAIDDAGNKVWSEDGSTGVTYDTNVAFGLDPPTSDTSKALFRLYPDGSLIVTEGTKDQTACSRMCINALGTQYSYRRALESDTGSDWVFWEDPSPSFLVCEGNVLPIHGDALQNIMTTPSIKLWGLFHKNNYSASCGPTTPTWYDVGGNCVAAFSGSYSHSDTKAQCTALGGMLPTFTENEFNDEFKVWWYTPLVPNGGGKTTQLRVDIVHDGNMFVWADSALPFDSWLPWCFSAPATNIEHCPFIKYNNGAYCLNNGCDAIVDYHICKYTTTSTTTSTTPTTTTTTLPTTTTTAVPTIPVDCSANVELYTIMQFFTALHAIWNGTDNVWSVDGVAGVAYDTNVKFGLPPPTASDSKALFRIYPDGSLVVAEGGPTQAACGRMCSSNGGGYFYGQLIVPNDIPTWDYWQTDPDTIACQSGMTPMEGSDLEDILTAPPLKFWGVFHKNTYTASCGPDGTWYDINGKCGKSIDTGASFTFAQAQAHCISLGGVLPTFTQNEFSANEYEYRVWWYTQYPTGGQSATPFVDIVYDYDISKYVWARTLIPFDSWLSWCFNYVPPPTDPVCPFIYRTGGAYCLVTDCGMPISSFICEYDATTTTSTTTTTTTTTTSTTTTPTTTSTTTPTTTSTTTTPTTTSTTTPTTTSTTTTPTTTSTTTTPTTTSTTTTPTTTSTTTTPTTTSTTTTPTTTSTTTTPTTTSTTTTPTTTSTTTTPTTTSTTTTPTTTVSTTTPTTTSTTTTPTTASTTTTPTTTTTSTPTSMSPSSTTSTSIATTTIPVTTTQVTITVTPSDLFAEIGLNEAKADSIAIQTTFKATVPYLLGQLDEETRMAAGHQLNETFIDCSFAETQCDMERDFKTWSSGEYGNCYTFNHNQYYRSARAGQTHGLKLTLQSETSDYMCMSESSGFRILFHDANEYPFPESLGTNFRAGSDVSITLSKTHVDRLPPPFGTCSDSVENYIYTGNYSLEGCFRTCYQRIVEDLCNCADPSVGGTQIAPFCTTEEKSCVDNIRECMDIDFSLCGCSQPCGEEFYESAATYAQLNFEDIKNKYCSKSGLTDTECQVVKNDMARLSIYFKKLSFHQFKEIASYDETSLASDMGGVLGLMIGLSFISVFELIGGLVVLLGFK